MQKRCTCQYIYDYQVLPEEGVVLNADLPQSLWCPMVGQLEAYGALKLFILSSEGDKWRCWRTKKGGEEEKESEGSVREYGGMVAGWIVFTPQQW